MKKILIGVLFVILLSIFSSNIIFAETIPTNQKIMYKNTIVEIKDPIMNIDGSLYVPIRTFSEKIGYIVDWSREGITLIKKSNKHFIPENTYKYINDKGYIKLRELGDLLSENIWYDDTSATAHIGSEPPTIISKKDVVIMLDAGHGGNDSGATDNGVEEKVVNLEITLVVKNLLEKDGYTVLLTRQDDSYISLSERYNYANEVNCNLFISIHNNSAYNTSAKGTEVLCQFGTESEILALNIQNALIKNLETTDRGLKDGSKMAVIRNTTMPAVIVEGLFISNYSDAKKLKDPNIINAIAQSIYEGIVTTK